MSRSISTVALLSSLSTLTLATACIVDNPFARIDTGADEETTDEVGTETGDGDGDGDTKGDGDGDTTGDGDGDTTGDGDGDTKGDGDGDTTGDPCTRRYWTFDFATATWAGEALDAVWTGPNAPPCNYEVWATTYIEPWDVLLVFSADGSYYRREGSDWLAPVPIATAFPELDGLEIESMVYVPPLDTPNTTLLINHLPSAYVYEIGLDGDAVLSEILPILNEPNGGPPQAQVVRHWALVLASADKIGDPDWWISWQGFEDDRIYRADGALNWNSWVAGLSPLFLGVNSPTPDPKGFEAAWGNYALDRGYFIEGP